MTNVTNNALTVIQQSAVALVDDDESRAISNSINAGLTGGGGFGNRLSLRGNRFRLVKGGVDVGVWPHNFLDIVMIAANPHVSRIYFAQQYEAGSKERPDCFSIDGKIADPEAPNRQNKEGGYKCMTCPQNVKGSSLKGDSKAKACAYKKRVIVAHPDDIGGDLYALDVNAMSLFGDDAPSQNTFNMKSYLETLSAHQMPAVKLVTRLTFDDESSVPKLFFSPIRMLTPDEWELVKEQMKNEAIQQMLADVINEAETAATPAPEKVQPQPQRPALQAVPARAPAPAPQPAPAAAPAPATAAPAPAPTPRRGRPTRTAPPAPAQPAQPASPNGSGARGFGAAAAKPAMSAADTSAQTAPVEVSAPKGKGFSIDLDDFDA